VSASAPETPTSPASNAAPAATPQSTPAAPVTETAKAAPAAEAKQAEPAKDEPKAEKFADKLAAAMKAPEKAEDKPADAEAVDLDLKVPEGADEHVVGFVKDAARIAGITGEKAQAVLDHVHKSLAEQRAAATEKVREDFARQLYEDKDYGGAKFEQTARDSAAFVRRFVPESAQKELEGKAIPPFLHIAFARAQQAISPDRFFQGKPASTASVDSDAERRNQRFPKSAPKG
jgi:hypothetical protein